MEARPAVIPLSRRRSGMPPPPEITDQPGSPAPSRPGSRASIGEKTMTEPAIVLVGGLGKTGRRVAERLAARGIVSRAASRSTDLAFDWNDHATWAPALRSATAAYVTYQ